MSEAFLRRPAPRQQAPTPEEIEHARAGYALHIRSLFTGRCLAPGCDEHWPCGRYRNVVPLLERANQFDVNGELRSRRRP